MSSSNLDLNPDEFRRWGSAALKTVAEYLGSIRDRKLYPKTNAAAIRARLSKDLPRQPQDFEKVLGDFDEVLLELSRHNAHPRMFGYVQSPGTAIAAIADLLASTLNANLTAWRSAPAAVEIERLTIDWIKQLVGYQADAGGLFVSGGSIANLAGLAAARSAKTPEVRETGALGVGKRMCVYASTETHHSIDKAAILLGLGQESVRKIPVNEQYKIRLDELVRAIEGDIAAGYLPFCVVANAGTVMTGAVDPLEQISEVARRFKLWMHVDGAYGGFAMLSPKAKPLFRGIEQADSIALDPHKWLYIPVDCGCVLYRQPQFARAAFALDADYTRVIGHEADEAFAFWDYGPELSRRFRALKVWMVLRAVGIEGLGRAVENDLACARHLEQLVSRSDNFEMMAPVELSIFCFRHLPNHLRESLKRADDKKRQEMETEIDRWNEQLLIALQHDGSSYLSNASINGRFCLRGCVINYRTTLQDMEILLDDLRRVAATLSQSVNDINR